MKILKKVAVALAACMCLGATGCVDFFLEESSCAVCVDENGDHFCDVCTSNVSACIDMDDNHLCDVCRVSTSQCIDGNHDHRCDVCDTVLSGCVDTNGNHHCDVCNLEISYCADQDENYRCDVCGKATGEDLSNVFYEVSYYVDGTLIKTQMVAAGNKAPMLNQQDKEFADFVGWTTDTSHANFYDFTREVSSNLNLYAYYETDYAAVTNELTTTYMKAMVTVHATYKQTVFSNLIYTSLGSGVIYKFDQSTNTYYMLTNNHVVYEYVNAKKENRADKLTIHDYCETEYSGTVVHHDAEYDLSIISFQKSTKEGDKYNLGVVELADSNPVAGQEVICIGNPHGQKNAISYGKALGYDYCNVGDASSHIDFLCAKHSAWMENGSSGGLLMDLNFRLIGINFAISRNASGDSTISWAVPVDWVKEFLADYH